MSSSMNFAYADPPYIGQAAKHYAGQEYYAEVNHRLLIAHLVNDFPDGWECSECGYWHIGGSDPERATHLAYSVDLICACERPFRRIVTAGQQMPEFCTVCRRAIRSELRSAAL